MFTQSAIDGGIEMRKELAKKIIETLEKFDFSVCSNEEQNGEMVAELEWYSEAGEDVVVTIWHKGTKQSFIDAFIEYAYDFDPDEHAEMWGEYRGEGGCPSSIRELIDDADGIKKHLEETGDALRKVA